MLRLFAFVLLAPFLPLINSNSNHLVATDVITCSSDPVECYLRPMNGIIDIFANDIKCIRKFACEMSEYVRAIEAIYRCQKRV